jgi:hypothetical protein
VPAAYWNLLWSYATCGRLAATDDGARRENIDSARENVGSTRDTNEGDVVRESIESAREMEPREIEPRIEPIEPRAKEPRENEQRVDVSTRRRESIT